MTENLWLLVVAGGPVLIALLIGVALFQRKRRTPAQRAATERATAELYNPKDRGREP